MNKILMKKIVMKQIKYRMCLFLYLKNFERFWVNHMLKKDFHKRLVKGTKIFMKKKKNKNPNTLTRDIKIFLKKKKKRSVNMVVNDIKIF